MQDFEAVCKKQEEIKCACVRVDARDCIDVRSGRQPLTDAWDEHAELSLSLDLEESCSCCCHDPSDDDEEDG